MLSVTDNFLAIWRNRASKFAVRKIKYKRRYLAGASIVYEENWQELRMSDFLQIGTKSATLDTVQSGVFNTSNIILHLRNSKHEWSPYNQEGIFGPDAVAANGYIPYRTMFQVEAGYELADGTEELTTQFLGYFVDFSMNPGTFEAEISGKELDFKEADAQRVSDTFGDPTPEATIPSIGNGTITDFRTTSTGVGFVDQVRVGGVVKKEGTDYTLSDIGAPGLGALISFVTAPAAAEGNIDTVGKKWKANKKLEELAVDLCDYCGFTASNRTIEAVVFPNKIPSVNTRDSQADWQNTGYSNANTDTASSAGDVKTALLVIPPLTEDSSGLPTSVTINYNTASWCVNLTRLDAAGYFMFLRRNYTATTTGRPTYYIKRVQNGGFFTYRIELWRQDPAPEPNPAVNTLLGYTAWVSGMKPVLITRNASTGRIFVQQKDDASYIDVTDTTYNATVFNVSGLFGLIGDYAMALPNVVDDVNGVFKADQCAYDSGEIDLLTVPEQWGQGLVYATLNSGTVTMQTSTAPTSGGTYEALSNLTLAGNIQSTLSRWFKFRLIFNHQAWNYLTPVVSKVTIGFYSTTIVVALADFSGKDCWQAFNTLARTCNYELQVNGAGKLLFRPKSTSTTPVIILDQRDCAGTPTMKPGWKEVRNNSQVSYPPYYKEYNSDTLPETAPTSKDIYKERIINVPMDGFLLANDADIATGMAQLGHDSNYRAKRRLRVPLRLIPFLELSDPIQLSYYVDPLDKNNIFGDPLKKFAPTFGDTTAVFLRDVLFKVVGINQQYKENKTDVQLEEILL